MKSDNKLITAKKLQSFAKKLHSVGNEPHLSRRQKRQMLNEIFPQKPLFLRLAPTFSAAFFAGLIVVSGLSFASQPGDLLYGVRRNIEDARSFVQPSYNEQLLKQRESEINKLKKSSDDENKLNIVNKEKQEIENRISNKQDSTKSDDSTSTTKPEDNSPTTTTNTTIDDSASHNGGSTGGGSTGGGGSTPSSTARDLCRTALDDIKKNGGNVDNTDYKKCDNL